MTITPEDIEPLPPIFYTARYHSLTCACRDCLCLDTYVTWLGQNAMVTIIEDRTRSPHHWTSRSARTVRTRRS